MKSLTKIIFALLFMFIVAKKITKKNKKAMKRISNRKSSKANNKQYYTTSYDSPNTLGSYTYVDPNDLVTPVTDGMISSGGNIYQTNAPYIPYGTGYSYGSWQKIPMK